MFQSVGRWVMNLAVCSMFVAVVPLMAYAGDRAKASAAPKGLQQRIDFGNAQILGQSIKSGAVYLMHRKKSDIKNMLEVRQNYRSEIKEDYDLDKTAISEGTEKSEKDTKK